MRTQEVVQNPIDWGKTAPGPGTLSRSRVTRRRFPAAKRVLTRDTKRVALENRRESLLDSPIGGCRPGSATPRIFFPQLRLSDKTAGQPAGQNGES
jgi:hypothetical protein